MLLKQKIIQFKEITNMISSFFDKTKVPLLEKAMDAYLVRHQIIADNIANIGTSGYKTKRVKFEEYLQDALGDSRLIGARTNENHIPLGKKSVENLSSTVNEENFGNHIASGVNDVDVDREMAELAKNQIQFKFSSQATAGIFQQLQRAIKG
jgi:flagellar basal-body rod protein FlgB